MTIPLTKSELEAAADACHEMRKKEDGLRIVASGNNDTDMEEHHREQEEDWHRLSQKFRALAQAIPG